MKLTGITIGEQYKPAMEITDQAEADTYFELLVAYTMGALAAQNYEGNVRARSEQITRQNIGYYAGYYDVETMQRVNKLYNTTHPVFGDTYPDPVVAFEAGKQLGENIS